MKIIALTGGIATGKTTVAKMFQKLGAVVLDADSIAHETYRPGTPLYREIVRRYGKNRIAPRGPIDRVALAAILFHSKKEKHWLESHIHPATFAAIGRRLRQAIKKKPPLILVEAALHVETGYHRAFPGLIVVSAPRAVQLKRLMGREGLSRAQALRRIAHQMPLKEKARHADWIIQNAGTLSKTAAQVKKLMVKLKGSSR